MITTLVNVKTYLDIDVTGFDDIIEMLIPKVEADYLTIRNADFDTDASGVTVYPTGAEVTACEMIGFKLEKRERLGASQERLADHSIAYEDANRGYPKSIVGNIEKRVTFI